MHAFPRQPTGPQRSKRPRRQPNRQPAAEGAARAVDPERRLHDEQASRGKDVYAGSCKACHTASTHTGETFAKWWRGKQLSDLFTFVSTRMPKNAPGTLAPEDVADVMAYLLKMNAMPVGPGELPPDVDSLKKFRIELKRTWRYFHRKEGEAMMQRWTTGSRLARRIAIATAASAVVTGTVLIRATQSNAKQGAELVRGNKPGEWRYWVKGTRRVFRCRRRSCDFAGPPNSAAGRVARPHQSLVKPRFPSAVRASA